MMPSSGLKTKSTQIIYAPPPSHSHLLSSIYSIEIREDQDVTWKWLVLPDGSRVVTDYQIINKIKQ